jgi:peptidoglycan/LPS O-acetylase OafA/YrhL
MAASPPPPARFENINLLRAFAALSVVVYHVIEHSNWTAWPQSGPLLTFRIGWYGVDLFFVISGFVIAYSALLLHRADADEFQRRYWNRRLTRILPLSLVTLFLYLAIFRPWWWWTPQMWVIQLATHLTFTHSFSTVTHGSIDGPNWSLGIEMQFYLAMALLVGWIDRTPAWRIALYCVLISWAWRAAMLFLYGGGADAFPVFVKVVQLPGQLDEFGSGIVLAKCVLDSRHDRFSNAVPWILGAAATGYATFAVFWSNGSYWDIPWMVVLWRTMLAAFFACVVGVAIALPQSLARRWVKPGDYLGETSYGIYLWHLFAVNAVVHRWHWSGVGALAAVAALTIALAAMSWHLFEKPAMRLGRG